ELYFQTNKFNRTLSAHTNPERAHASIEVAAIDAHKFRRARDVAFSFVQLALNELAMIRVAGFFEGGKAIRRSGRFSAAERRQVFYSDAMRIVHDHDSLDRVL